MPSWPFQQPITPMEATVRDDLFEGDCASRPQWDEFGSMAWSLFRRHDPARTIAVFEQLRAEDYVDERDGLLSYDAARTDLGEQPCAVVLRNHPTAPRT